MSLNEAKAGRRYVVRDILTGDEETNSFLRSLGLFVGEKITVISHLWGGPIVCVRGTRYNLDKNLAAEIIL